MKMLEKDYWFPDVTDTYDEGLLMVGGNLSADMLFLAYRNGVFPWFIDAGLVHWFCPEERFVLYPDEIRISDSMRQLMKKKAFTVTEDKNFEQVIKRCSSFHKSEKGSTWISQEFIEGYCELHRLGYAKSIEVWENEILVGGLYGVVIGNIFCGESMFSLKSNASKTALIYLCQNKNYALIDCQIFSSHLETMGAKLIKRDLFLKQLKEHGTDLPKN